MSTQTVARTAANRSAASARQCRALSGSICSCSSPCISSGRAATSGIDRRRFRKPKDEGRAPSEIPNRIKHLCPIGPNVFWVGDFTDLAFYGRHIYLATVVDQYTREVVGWSIGLHHTAQLVIDALEHARFRRGTPHIFHSDQGSEYDSLACRAWLMAHQILPSHSKKSSPWENGHQESFYGKFKEEVGSLYRFKSLDELLEGIYIYIHYYNNRRMHRSLKMTPVQKYMEAIRQKLMPQIKEGSVPTLVEKAKWRNLPAGQSKSPRSTAKEARHAGE